MYELYWSRVTKPLSCFQFRLSALMSPRIMAVSLSSKMHKHHTEVRWFLLYPSLFIIHSCYRIWYYL